MKRKIVYIVTVIAVLCSMCSYSFASDFMPQASKMFTKHVATLEMYPSGMQISYTVATNLTNAKLGVSKCTLYDQTAHTAAFTWTINQFVAARQSTSSFDVPGTTKGHQYYAKVTFYADGKTYDYVTNSVYA